jgi:glycosyltransferase involved in cell wall biosynthesis
MDYFIIYKEDYPWDVRVEKLALSLAGNGEDVTIISKNLNQHEIADEQDEIKIKRLPRFRSLPRILVRLFNSPLWFNPFWLYTIGKTIKGSAEPVIIIRDLPLVFAAFFFKFSKGAKLVLDMAECYPEMYASSLKFGSPSILDRTLKNPSVAAVYEKISVKMCDHVLVMIEESKDRLIRKGLSPEKISIVSNTPPIYSTWSGSRQHSGENLRVVYVGFITELRGLDILVRATKKFLDKVSDKDSIKVDIIGKGSFKEKLVDLVRELGLEGNVSIHGWLEPNQMDEILRQANVGALTYRVCGHWNHTIPNKLFDYMLAGLPVLATEVIPISRIIHEEKCGLICRDQDVDDIASKLLELRDARVRQRFGDNGVAAISGKYNWEVDERKLMSALSSLK